MLSHFHRPEHDGHTDIKNLFYNNNAHNAIKVEQNLQLMYVNIAQLVEYVVVKHTIGNSKLNNSM